MNQLSTEKNNIAYREKKYRITNPDFQHRNRRKSSFLFCIE